MSEHHPLARMVDEPHVEGGVHHPYSAYNQGYDGWEDGHPYEANPYEDDSREAHWWALGWLEARDHGDEPPDPPSMTGLSPRRAVARKAGGGG